MANDLQEAQKLYQDSLDAMSEQRKQIGEDLRFSDPSDPRQWEDDVKLAREGDPGGKRPCLVMDQIGQYVANVAGQIEKQPPSIHAIPVGGGAEKEAAEQIDGRFRHIEHASKAGQHYARALTSAARAGVGYLIVRPDYVNRALNWQEPRISSESDPLNVVLDPWSVDTDGADATFGYILTSMSLASFDRRWKGKGNHDFGDTASSRLDDKRTSVLIAEQWYEETITKNMIVYTDANGEEATGTEDEYHAASHAAGAQLRYQRNYTDKQQQINWRRMSGDDVLEESIYPADSIGIIPVYGYVGFSNGRMRYCGIPRRARAPQQAYNYHMSEQLAYIGTAPKSPWWVSKRAAAGVEELLDRMSTQSRAWMPYNDIDAEGAIAAPTRISPSVGLMNHQAGAEQAIKDIQAAIGMYQANLGAQSNETSGVAIESRKQQGEASTAHFPAHMAASLGQVGNIVMQMDARLSDTRRKQPIIGVDQSAGSVTVDPQQKDAFRRGPDGVTINPNVGKYGVRVVVGASYSTQRTQTNAAFTEIMRGNPELSPTVAPFWAQTLDFPGSDKFAQAMAAMAPPPVKAILQPEGQANAPDPAQLAHELDQCKQALQEAIGHAHDAQAEADEAQDKLHKAEADNEAAMYEAHTNRLKVTGANAEQIQVLVREMLEQMLSEPGASLPGDPAGGYPDAGAPPQGGELQQPPGPQIPDQPAEPAPAGFSSSAQPLGA